MPIPSPGNVDNASQTTLLAVKAKTDNLPAAPAAQAKLDSSLYTSRLAPVHVEGNMAAGAPTLVTIDIQPPAGETWVINIKSAVWVNAGATYAYVAMYYYDGALRYGGVTSGKNTTLRGANFPEVGEEGTFRITNAMYIRLQFEHSNAGDVGRYLYSYWGWKE